MRGPTGDIRVTRLRGEIDRLFPSDPATRRKIFNRVTNALRKFKGDSYDIEVSNNGYFPDRHGYFRIIEVPSVGYKVWLRIQVD